MTDIRLVIRDLGKFEGQIERLIADVGKLDGKLSTLTTSVDRFKTAIWVVGACLAIFLPALGSILWWAVGERINAVLRPEATIAAPAVSVPKPPLAQSNKSP
jgi:hypothetical protein